MSETSAEVVRRYLADAISAERSFEAQLREFASDGSNQEVKNAFDQQALEVKRQYEALTARLENLGGNVSGVKTLLATISGLRSRAQPEDGLGPTTQNLILAFAAENSKVALYETVAVMSEAAGDPETAALVRLIQNEHKAAAEKFWELLPRAVFQEYEDLAREHMQESGKGTAV